MAQTFANFEVIVVDDCSTDSSCAIVQSYAEKFGGRLTLSRMEKILGSGPAVPRNKGLTLSRGEYVYFMDADDLLTKTALEELYTLAKKYDADCVYCEKYYTADADGTNIKLTDWPIEHSVDKPTFESENLEERVQNVLKRRYWVTTWVKFTRRNLLLENEIFFSDVKRGDDDIWTYVVIFYAKKFLRVPNAVYIYRQSDNSIGRKDRTPTQTINFWLNPLLLGLKTLDKLIIRHEFFKSNPQYHYAILEQFVEIIFNMILNESLKLEPFKIYDTIKQEFDGKLGEHDVLISALCAALNTQQKINVINVQNFNEYAAQAQAYIAQIEAELKRRN